MHHRRLRSFFKKSVSRSDIKLTQKHIGFTPSHLFILEATNKVKVVKEAINAST